MFRDSRINQAVQDFKRIYQEQNNIEDVLREMRILGYSLFETVIALAENTGFDREEADKIVLESIAWNDRKEKANEFRKETMRIMIEDSNEIIEDDKGNMTEKIDLAKFRKDNKIK